MSTNLLASITPPLKSKTASLAELLPGIEGARAVGHTHGAIYEYIKNTIGLDITYRYYQLTLHRVRAKRAKELAAVQTPGQVRQVHTSIRPPAHKPPASPAGQPQLDNSEPKFKYDVTASIDDFFS